MRLHDLVLIVSQGRRFLQYDIIDSNLTHIMEHRTNPDLLSLFIRQAQALRNCHRESRHALRVTPGVWVLAVDSGRQTLDRSQEQLTILVYRALEVVDITLNLVGHQIE